MIHTNDHDPAMRFEGFLRAAFNHCNKAKDPFGYAKQEVFSNFVPEPNMRGRRALSTGLIKIIIDNPESHEIDELKSLEDRVWTASKQKQIIEIIDDGIQILKRLGYQNK